MWAELGGVLDQDMAAKLERDVASVEAGRHWVLVIVTADGTAAGTVSLWGHEWDGETIDEIGWMVLPEHQGRGLADAGGRRGAQAGGRGGPLAGAPCLPGDDQGARDDGGLTQTALCGEPSAEVVRTAVEEPADVAG